MSLYEDKNYEEAATELKKAYELRQLPRVLLNLGTVYRKMGKADLALEFYERYLKAEPDPPPKIKKDLDAFIAQTKALVEAKEPVAQSSPTVAEKPTANAQTQTTQSGQPAQEEAKPVYKRAWFWGVIGGVAAAAIITGVAVGVVANQRKIPDNIDVIQLQLSF